MYGAQASQRASSSSDALCPSQYGGTLSSAMYRLAFFSRCA
jgi:hypothetical protein